MSRTNENRQFAYGCDTVGGCACPAVQAGYSPSSGDESFEVAETFDREVMKLSGTEYDGVVSEDVARSAWERAIDALVDGGDEEYAAVGEEIAAVLGWEVTNE